MKPKTPEPPAGKWSKTMKKLGFKETKDLRFFLYISSLKVDSLFSRISGKGFAGKISAELNLAIAKASIEASRSEPDLEKRLEEVERFLEKKNLVGDPEGDRPFFRATLPGRWGIYDEQRKLSSDGPLVFFVCLKDGPLPLMVGLGGSSRHLIGANGASSTHSRSSTSELSRWLRASEVSGEAPEPLPFWDESERRNDEINVLGGVALAARQLRPPTQRLTVLAKRLLSGTLEKSRQYVTGKPRCRVVLGTPLFVEQHDTPEYDEEIPWEEKGEQTDAKR